MHGLAATRRPPVYAVLSGLQLIIEVLPFRRDGPDTIHDVYNEMCVDCGRSIYHGVQRYFQRNDPADGRESDALKAALMALTYDPVCGVCGDRILRGDAT